MSSISTIRVSREDPITQHLTAEFGMNMNMNAVSILESLSEILCCPVCMGQYSPVKPYENAPLTTSCGHTLCVACLTKMTRREKNLIVICCPICRDVCQAAWLMKNYVLCLINGSLCEVLTYMKKARRMADKGRFKRNVIRNILENLGKILSCPLCSSHYSGEVNHPNNPVTRGCGHSCCVSCFENKIRSISECSGCLKRTFMGRQKICYTMCEVTEAVQKLTQIEEPRRFCEKTKATNYLMLCGQVKKHDNRRISQQEVYFSNAKRRTIFGNSIAPQRIQPPRRGANNRRTSCV